MEIGAEMVVQTTQGIIEKNVETRVQKSFIQGSEVLKPAPKLTRELCHIDWDDSTKHVYNLIRGLSPYPAAFTELVKDGSASLQLKIYSAEPVTSVNELPSGRDGGSDASLRSAPPLASQSAAPVPPLTVPRVAWPSPTVPSMTATPGKIISDGKSYLWIMTRDGAISLKEVQLAGKKRMGIEAFLLGFRDPETFSTTPGTSKAEIAKTKVAQ